MRANKECELRVRVDARMKRSLARIARDREITISQVIRNMIKLVIDSHYGKGSEHGK